MSILALILSFYAANVSAIHVISQDYVPSNYTTRIDHFNNNPGNFSMRVFTNAKYYVKGGPLFFYPGNEGPIEAFIDASRFIETIAANMSGMILYAEHRYFGKSQPFGKESMSTLYNRQFLSPDQALADYADLLQNLNQTYTWPKIVAYGGSYAGMLSAWFRMKYPHIIDIAFASSAPVTLFSGLADPVEISKRTSWQFGWVDPKCESGIHDSMLTLLEMFGDESHFDAITKTLNSCTSLSNENKEDLYQWVRHGLEYLAMVNYPYPTDFLEPIPAWPVKEACKSLQGKLAKDSSQLGQLDALFSAVKIFFNYNDILPCVEFVEKNRPGILQTPEFKYLLCTSLIGPYTSNGKTDFLRNEPWDLKKLEATCMKAFGIFGDPQKHYREFGLTTQNNTSWLEGHSHIMFSNGVLDPLNGGGILRNVSDTIISFVIEEAAHHLDLREPHEDDGESVKFWREFEINKLREWLGFNQDSTPSCD